MLQEFLQPLMTRSKLKKLTRRKFLQSGSLAVAGTSLGLPAEAAAALDPSKLTPFVDPLPVPRVARAVGTRPNPEDPAVQVPYYRIAMRAMQQRIHRDLPATPMWGFDGSFPGPTLEIESGKGALVEWVNELPQRHFLPIDHTLHGAEATVPEVRSVVHLHGGRTPTASDGYPEDWVVPGKSQTCFYPSRQDAALLFYHDHTMGINRLNIYAGLQGFAIVRDPIEATLNLPSGKFEIPLMICDRLLRADGQLDYPISEMAGHPWVPEVFGNVLMVNGKMQPYLDVEPRRYRLRLMNGSNGRFYRFSLAGKNEFQVIANDQGLLRSRARAARSAGSRRAGRHRRGFCAAGRHACASGQRLF